MNIKGVFKKQGYNNLKIRIAVSIAILVVVLTVFIVFLFLNPKTCESFECFYSALSECKKVSYIKEDSEAIWRYSIKGFENKNSCNVEVELLRAKKGTIEIEKLIGKKMRCIVNRSEKRFPEENMRECSGILKEKIQEIIIERMHNYILENIKGVKENFNSI